MNVVERLEFLNELLGLVRNQVGRDNKNCREQIAALPFDLHASIANAQNATAWSVCRDLDLDPVPLERRDLDCCTQNCFRNRDRNINAQIVAVAIEDRVIANRDGYDEVARGSARHRLFALVAHTNFLLIVHASRDCDLERPGSTDIETDLAALNRGAEVDGDVCREVGALSGT
ncbi:unannotated protein [freshwater metagenome]|uniref:Unannotated protein n=1 Tax=freshwater metagenome TaxID=449393 RepID=A0A6J7DDU1_9ZZZZ